MSKARVIFIVGFVLAMAAGVVVGMVAARAPVKPATPRSDLDAYLELTPEQAEKVHAIWSGVSALTRGRNDRRRALNKDRDEAILQLIPADRKADYDRIQQEHAAKVAEFNKEHERLIAEAEQKMKEVLTVVQWNRFEDRKKERAEQWKKNHPATTQSAATQNAVSFSADPLAPQNGGTAAVAQSAARSTGSD